MRLRPQAAVSASSGDLIVLHLYTATPGQDERLVVLDPANGGLVGTFALGAK